MIAETEERLLKYIKERAKKNIEGKSFFTITDLLEQAFYMPKDSAYEVLKNIMGKKDIGNSQNAIINEYITMLRKGFYSIQEQVEVFGGDKLSRVISIAENRIKKYNGGTFFEVLKYVYNVSEEDILMLIEKYLNFLRSPSFVFRLDTDSFHKFLESDLEELDKQFQRFLDL
ncbi:hypothetical protein [Clostridium saccharobutylicum]|uniref:Uncharacterized protein n=1 Tax=Clostridium saccharobutylicum TaxID=169679 RepID=A0A1S8MT94_CLOSA|nr:hypothetical protein [Clostridium saccharobutylicum]OOM07397.1 hypothetical protein CLOSAC_39260 [Clostridium saccharobutylicum]